MQGSFITQYWTDIWQYTLDSALLGVVAPLIGLVVSIPVGIACVARRWLYPPVLSLTSALYALPSLALFVVLIDYTGLGNVTVLIPLTLYSFCVLVPSVVDGLRGVPDAVRQAATAMGFGPLRRLVQVDLPLAVPVVMAGLRVAVVSSISLASVSQLIGVSSIGWFFTDGEQRAYPADIYAGLVLTILLALLCDLILVAIRRILTPWARDQPIGRSLAAAEVAPPLAGAR